MIPNCPALTLKKMMLSVIVPFLNEQQHIEQCISSLLNQQDVTEEHEFIFIDNNSTDRSRDLVTAHSQITLLDEPIADPYIAKNRGIEAASGDYLVFLDADCQPLPNWISQYQAAIEAQNPDFLLGNLFFPEPMSRQLRCHQDYYNAKTAYLLKHELRSCYYGHAGNMVIRKSVFEETGLFKGMPEVGDTAIIHDLLAIRPHARIVHVPEARVVHLEVTSFSRCMGKLQQSGTYTRDYETMNGFRTLTMWEKLAVMNTCATTHRYSLWKRGILLAALYEGWRAFEKGHSS